ncbi:MAG: hypothetical protein K1X53_00945 [Candidatus Sumerlaeaceae bacterium]|nr:hypothetical protein [Candidatus Sumerlaeaceae bacterium]
MASTPPPGSEIRSEVNDLGFGSRVADTTQARFLNRDGTFNVRRRGLALKQSLSIYHTLLTTSWPRFFGFVIANYLVVNLIFAGLYLLAGPEGLHGTSGTTSADRFHDAFFFSVQTLSTIGYGRISPVNLWANLLVTVESFMGLMGLALATGMCFARFSRPVAHIQFSRNALIAPYRGITALELRIINTLNNQLIETRAKVMFARLTEESGRKVRRFFPLPLERNDVMFFPLQWTIVHPITETSPLYGLGPADLAAMDAEFLILLTGTDETFSQSVHARSSYKHNEIVFGARFTSMFVNEGEGKIQVDMRKLDDFESAELPTS